MDYAKQTDRDFDASPVRDRKSGGKREQQESDSDTDFQAHESEDDVVSGEEEGDAQVSVQELEGPPASQHRTTGTLGSQASQRSPVDREGKPILQCMVLSYCTKANSSVVRTFKRAKIPSLTPSDVLLSASTNGTNAPVNIIMQCIACGDLHKVGYCPLKLAGTELCNLCGLPHYGYQRTCPHLNSITQLRAMIEALKQSTEPLEYRNEAKKKIVGIIGELTQRRKQKQQKQLEKSMQQIPVNATRALRPSASAGRYGANRVQSMNGVGDGKENKIGAPFTGFPPSRQ